MALDGKVQQLYEMASEIIKPHFVSISSNAVS